MTEPRLHRRDQRLFLPRLAERAAGRSSAFSPASAGCRAGSRFSTRWREERTVIVPSLPGFPGGERGHTVLDTPSRLGAGGAPAAAQGRARRRRSRRQLGRRLARRRGGGDLAAVGQAPGADRAVRPVRREGPGDRSVGAARPRRAGAAVRRPGALGGAEGRARGPELAGMADRADARRRGRGPHLLAARQHQARKAPAADRGADPAAVGRAGPHHAAQLRRQIRRARSRAGPKSRIIPGAGHLAELDKPDEVAAAILEWTR